MHPCNPRSEQWRDLEVVNCGDCLGTAENEAFCLKVVLLENRTLSNPLSQSCLNLEITFHIHFFFSPFFGLCQQQSNKVHRLSEGKPVNFCLEDATLGKKCYFSAYSKMHYLSTTLFYVYEFPIWIRISFKRHFTFHSDYWWLDNNCGLVCARPSRFF